MKRRGGYRNSSLITFGKAVLKDTGAGRIPSWAGSVTAVEAIPASPPSPSLWLVGDSLEKDEILLSFETVVVNSLPTPG